MHRGRLTDMHLKSLYTWALAFGGLASSTDAFVLPPSSAPAMRPRATGVAMLRKPPAVATAASIHAPGCPCGGCGTEQCRMRTAKVPATALTELNSLRGVGGVEEVV
jgi:hypothetical protein